MLFDLRSRGRRRTVQGVYLFLAILLGGGLVLFGVGAGNGLGGLLNAFNGGGSTSGQKSVVSQQEKNAIKATQVSPDSAQAWANLVQARWTAAGQGANFNSSTGQFTASGLNELKLATQDWQRYLKLTKNPDPNLAVARRPRLRRPAELRRRGQRLGHRDARRSDRGQGLRVPRRIRLRRRADPQGRSRLDQGPHPRAQGPADPAQAGDQPGQDAALRRPAMLTAPSGDRRVTSPPRAVSSTGRAGDS